jgi:hypothetical protein
VSTGAGTGGYVRNSAESPNPFPAVTIDSSVHPAVVHDTPSQPDPVSPPIPVPGASAIGGSAGGLGAVFFFGLAALLASAGLVRPRGISVLRGTADAAAPQPFLALLERPG